MARSGSRLYRFSGPAHWAGGASSGLVPAGAGLVLAPSFAASRIEESTAGIVAATDACGRPAWLGIDGGELSILHDFGPVTRGRVAAAGRPESLWIGPRRIWLHERDRLSRYDADSLQRLGGRKVAGLLGACSDGGDGLWLLLRRGAGASVRHMDGWGRPARNEIALRGADGAKAIAADPAGRTLYVLDGPVPGRGLREWRLHRVDVASCSAGEPDVFRLAPDQAPPDFIAFDRGQVHLLPAAAPALLLSLDPAGREVSRRELDMAEAAWPLHALLGGAGLLVGASDGVHRIGPAGSGDRRNGAAGGFFVTPSLTSPPATPGGWNRADIDVVLPKGTSLRVTVAASDDSYLAQSIRSEFAGAHGDAVRLAAAADLLPWERTRLFAGGGGRQRLRFLLDRIPQTHLWLKLEFTAAAGAEPPSLLGLSIHYPDASFLDALPAIYREQPGPAAQLRQFLAPFEALFDDIDAQIDDLPRRIDPDTAPAAWLPYLLTWLGFPPTIGLDEEVQRALLRSAPDLLERRGTAAALRDMLEIVTGARAEVADSAELSGFWFVGDSGGRLAPRLGRDTRIVAGFPAAFTLGRAARLNGAALGTPCTDVARLLARQCGSVRIAVAIDTDRRAMLVPIVRSLLALFVPAHCRFDLVVRPAAAAGPAGRLGRDRLGGGPDRDGDRMNLAGRAEAGLGRTTRLGCWPLFPGEPMPFTIDKTAALDGARRLA